jgi:hypothetical protein
MAIPFEFGVYNCITYKNGNSNRNIPLIYSHFFFFYHFSSHLSFLVWPETIIKFDPIMKSNRRFTIIKFGTVKIDLR